jgi:hypothetical protein
VLALTLIREDRTPRVKCCVSCLSIRSHGSQVRVSPLVAQMRSVGRRRRRPMTIVNRKRPADCQDDAFDPMFRAT